MRPPRCPNCRRRIVRRAPREGAVDRVLRHFGVAPFRCQLCGRRFRALAPTPGDAARAGGRREYDRVDVTLPVSVSFHQQHATGLLVSLSLGGAAIATELHVPEGGLVQVQIDPPGAAPIPIDGALVRSVKTDVVRVQFVWARVEAKERLRELVLRALGHQDVDAAMLSVKKSGVGSPTKLTDLWVAVVALSIGLID